VSVLLIIAENYRQACDYARKNSISPGDWRFIDRPEKLLGLRKSYFVIASYPKNYEELEPYISANEMIEVRSPDR